MMIMTMMIIMIVIMTLNYDKVWMTVMIIMIMIEMIFMMKLGVMTLMKEFVKAC